MAPGRVRRHTPASTSVEESSGSQPLSSNPSNTPSGSQPLSSNPSNIPTSSSASVTTKRGRGLTKGIGLEKYFKAHRKKMVIEIPREKERPINVEQSAKLSNELGIIARNMIPVPRKWKSLSQEDKDVAIERLNGRLEIIGGDHVRANVESLLKSRSRDERYRLHQRYLKYGSTEEAKRHPPKTVSLENWIDLCDLFAEPDYQNICIINKNNRSKKTIPHNTGSRSFVVERSEKRNEETGAELGRIDFYELTHYKEGKGWTSRGAKERHEEMVRLKNQPAENGSQLTEDEIADKVLGTRSDCILGLGSGPKPPKSRSSQSKAYLEQALRESTRKQEELAARVEALESARGVDSEALNKYTKIFERMIAAGFPPSLMSD